MSFGPEHKSTFAESILQMFDSEREAILADLPQEPVPFAGPLPEANAYVCISNGVIQIYLLSGGWLGCKAEGALADAAPWAD